MVDPERREDGVQQAKRDENKSKHAGCLPQKWAIQTRSMVRLNQEMKQDIDELEAEITSTLEPKLT